jgi:hypothetical protein
MKRGNDPYYAKQVHIEPVSCGLEARQAGPDYPALRINIVEFKL